MPRTLQEIMASELEISHPIIEPDFDEFEPAELVALLAKEDSEHVAS